MKCKNEHCGSFDQEWLFNCNNLNLPGAKEGRCPDFKACAAEPEKKTVPDSVEMGRPQACPVCGRHNPTGFKLPEECMYCGINQERLKDEPSQKSAAKPEPEPTGSGDIVLPQVVQDLMDRAKAGKGKYGTYLRTDNGRNALMDAYQESLDLCMYLKQCLMEQDGK